MKIYRTEGEIRGLFRRWLKETTNDIAERDEFYAIHEYRTDLRTISDVQNSFIDVVRHVRLEDGLTDGYLFDLLDSEASHMSRKHHTELPEILFTMAYNHNRDDVMNAMKTDKYKTEVKRSFVGKLSDDERKRFLQLLLMFDEEDEVRDVMEVF